MDVDVLGCLSLVVVQSLKVSRAIAQWLLMKRLVIRMENHLLHSLSYFRFFYHLFHALYNTINERHMSLETIYVSTAIFISNLRLSCTITIAFLPNVEI